jgi:hypothetical protein
MLDDSDYDPTERLWDLLGEKFGFSIRINCRPETLTIADYRPTNPMAVFGGTFVVMAVLFVSSFLKFGFAVPIILWATGLPALVFLVLALRSSIREVYYFDKANDSYRFIRQFVYRKEVIDGAMGQFTGSYVKTVYDSDAGDIYYVILKQEGMFLTGVAEQVLREDVPMFNSYDNESSIADAITDFLRQSGVDQNSMLHLSG